MSQKDFIQKWINLIDSDLLKKFPGEFITNEETFKIILPATTLTLGAELFGSFEINDINGNVVYQAPDYSTAKYILYSNRYKLETVIIPKKQSDVKLLVSRYDNHLDQLLRTIKSDFELEFPESKEFIKVSNIIFNNLRLQRY